MLKLDWHEDLSKAYAIWVKGPSGEVWVWQKGKSIKSHDPADRVGGPYRLTGFVDEGSGEHVYIFAVVDSHFPIHDLVRADSFEDAYEAYIDWAAKRRHLAISDGDLKDYDQNSLTYTSNGIPVDTDNIRAQRVLFLKATASRNLKMLERFEEHGIDEPGPTDWLPPSKIK